MPTSDLTMPLMFLVFLSAFVLIGLFPAFQRTHLRILRYLRTLGEAGEPDRAGWEVAPAGPHAVVELYEFEVLVLGRLARSGLAGLSLRRLSADLHLDRPFVEKALAALYDKGLVLIVLTFVAGRRFYLSDAGRDYARDQGLDSSSRP